MAVSFFIFGVAMSIATFIENDYGTSTAKAVVYNTKWFELLMLLMIINFIGNIFTYRLYRFKKWPVLLFHVAFAIIIIGAFVTRYYGYEGIMPIREGKQTSTVYSDRTFINVRVDNNKVQKNYEKSVLFGRLGTNSYSISDKFGDTNDSKIPFSVELTDYVPHAMEYLEESDTGDSYIHLVESSTGVRKDVFLKDGEIKSIRNILFTYNNHIDGGMNFSDKSGKPTIQFAFDGKLMEMVSQEILPVKKDSIDELHLRQLYSFDEDIKFVVLQVAKGVVIKKTAPADKQAMHPYDAVSLLIKSGEEEKSIEVRGTSGAVAQPERVSLNGLNFNVSYGSIEYKLPFEVKLRDFELERYPGTNSASSYASEITVLDKDQSMDYRVYMNHVLDYKGFRFFQSSYDKDEQGTVLSVNHDYWGTIITYLGYFLMGLGMFISLFWNGTRFKKLSEKLKAISQKSMVLVFIVFGSLQSGLAQLDNLGTLSDNTVSREHADKFGKLLIQDHQGRIKPVNTYALETLRKIYKKDNYKGLSAEQIILSAQVNPRYWGQEEILKVRTTAIGSEMTKKLKVNDGYAAIMSFFPGGSYLLEGQVGTSFRKMNIDRNATDKEIINLDERVNVWWSVLRGSLINIYPKAGDVNNKWYTGVDHEAFVGADTMVLKMHDLYMYSLQEAMASHDYTDADKYLDLISQSQMNISADLLPPMKKINLEIAYNKWNIFKILMFYFMAVGFVFLFLAFYELFKPNNKLVKMLLTACLVLTIVGLVAHLAGLGVRWYISGHEPWSNGYEAVVFVAFVSIIAGLIFSFRKSKFTIASTVLFASFLLGIAHGSMMNPEITNLVPVLKSYWLMIHVAVITASYGFLGLSALLGGIVMLLYILRTPNTATRINNTINELTLINESTMIVGLYALSLGTFLGGVWASESWGRYWSWDPKEVWSLISMFVYIFILHMRIVPGLKGKFFFNLTSMFSIATLIMTFFGVNYYLSGMHSYAAGDPVPIPKWIYVAVMFFVVFANIAYWRYSKFEENKQKK